VDAVEADAVARGQGRGVPAVDLRLVGADVGADVERDEPGELGDELLVVVGGLEVAVVGDRPGGPAVRPGEAVCGVEMAQQVVGVEAVGCYFAVGRVGEVVQAARRAEVARVLLLGGGVVALVLRLLADVVAERGGWRCRLVGGQVCGAPRAV
jgi:hypothetical protein